MIPLRSLRTSWSWRSVAPDLNTSQRELSHPKRHRSVVLAQLALALVLVVSFLTIFSFTYHRFAYRNVNPLNPLPSYEHWVPTDAIWDLLGRTGPPPDVATSTRWAPTAISTCNRNTQPYYAPCIAERTHGAMYAEELVYPDFQLRAPVFAPSREQDDQRAWDALLDGIRERGARCSEDGWICYRGQHGQNIIIVNATYTGDPPADSWSDKACMSDGVSAQGIRVQEPSTTLTDAEYAAAYPVDHLLIATSPDSWSFQHFLDRVVHIVAQGTHLTRDAPMEVITGRSPGKAVSEMWDMLGFPDKSIHHRGPVGAKIMIFSCRAPLVHPWLSYRTLEKFDLNSTDVPLANRKKVVYMSRSHGRTSNSGRRVLNEDELLSQIRVLLASRGQDEELVLFNQDDFHSQRELMHWFHDNVRAIIGPHGGALFNHRWAGTETLVLEMMPTSFTSLMFWEEASILGQVYANMILEAAGGNNMNADIPAVLEILRDHLGKADARGPAISEMYRWRGPEVQMPFRSS